MAQKNEGVFRIARRSIAAAVAALLLCAVGGPAVAAPPRTGSAHADVRLDPPISPCPAGWPRSVHTWWLVSDPTQQVEYCEAAQSRTGYTDFAVVNNSGYVWDLTTQVSVGITVLYTLTPSLVFHHSGATRPSSIAPGDIVEIQRYYTDLVPVLDRPRTVAYWSVDRLVSTAAKRIGNTLVTDWATNSLSRQAFVACANAVWTDVSNHPKLSAHPQKWTPTKALSVAKSTLNVAKKNVDCASDWKSARASAADAPNLEKPFAKLSSTISTGTRFVEDVDKVQTDDEWLVKGIAFVLEKH